MKGILFAFSLHGRWTGQRHYHFPCATGKWTARLPRHPASRLTSSSAQGGSGGQSITSCSTILSCPWFAAFNCYLSTATHQLPDFGMLVDYPLMSNMTDRLHHLFLSHGGHSHRQIAMSKAELLYIGSTNRSIQALSLDHHDIRLDVMEGNLWRWRMEIRIAESPFVKTFFVQRHYTNRQIHALIHILKQFIQNPATLPQTTY